MQPSGHIDRALVAYAPPAFFPQTPTVDSFLFNYILSIWKKVKNLCEDLDWRNNTRRYVKVREMNACHFSSDARPKNLN